MSTSSIPRLVSAAVLFRSRVGAANQSSECLRSIYFPLGVSSFVGRGLTSYYCKQTSECERRTSASSKRTSQSPSVRIVVEKCQAETQLDDSQLEGRSVVDRVTLDLTDKSSYHPTFGQY